MSDELNRAAPAAAQLDAELPPPDVCEHSAFSEPNAYSRAKVEQIVAQYAEVADRRAGRSDGLSAALAEVTDRLGREAAENLSLKMELRALTAKLARENQQPAQSIGDDPEFQALEIAYTRALGAGDVAGAIEARKAFLAYIDGGTAGTASDAASEAKQPAPPAAPTEEPDPLYDTAVKIVRANNRASISLVQHYLRIGYNRAARLIEQMERNGLVSSVGAYYSLNETAAPSPQENTK